MITKQKKPKPSTRKLLAALQLSNRLTLLSDPMMVQFLFSLMVLSPAMSLGMTYLPFLVLLGLWMAALSLELYTQYIHLWCLQHLAYWSFHTYHTLCHRCSMLQGCWRHPQILKTTGHDLLPFALQQVLQRLLFAWLLLRSLPFLQRLASLTDSSPYMAF